MDAKTTSAWRARLAALPARRHWQRLTRRERLALAALALFLLATLLYVAVWQPALRFRDEARATFVQQRELQAYLRARASEVTGVPARETLEPERLQGIVASSAARHELVLERLDGEVGGGVQVALQPADAARLLQWLAALQGQGVAVEEAGIERHPDNRVSARLTLRAAP